MRKHGLTADPLFLLRFFMMVPPPVSLGWSMKYLLAYSRKSYSASPSSSSSITLLRVSRCVNSSFRLYMVLILLARICTISSVGPDIRVLSFFCMVGDSTSTLEGGLTSPFWILMDSGRLRMTVPVGVGGAGMVGGGGRTGGAGRGLLTLVIGGPGIPSDVRGGGGPGGGGG